MIRRLSGHLRDGVMALAPTSVELVIGALSGALLLLAAPPLWYLGRCVLSDVVAYRILNPEAPPTACEPIPDISPAIWLGVLGVLVVSGVVYSIIHAMLFSTVGNGACLDSASEHRTSMPWLPQSLGA